MSWVQPPVFARVDRIVRVATSLSALALLASGCSGDDAGTDATATAGSTAVVSTTANDTSGVATSSGSSGSTTGASTAGTATMGDATTAGGTTAGTATTAMTSATGDTGTSSTSATTGAPTTGTEESCFDELPVPAGPEAVLAEEYVGTYFAYDLGPVPAPGDTVLPRLGGLVIAPDDPNTMYIVGPSEVPDAQLHKIGVERGECGHIIGFVGEAEFVLTSPYLDLMVNGPMDTVFISHYPTQGLSQYLPGADALSSNVTLAPLSGNQSPGGINFVPPGYPDEGMLRVMSFPLNHAAPGEWHHVDISHNGVDYDLAPLQKTVEIEHGPGGFAYIPEGSPLFPEQRIIVTEWLSNPQSVSSYAVDDEGDPIPETRKLFFESFVKPWGSYFEPETGDYMFLQWENMPDHIYIVQGFVPPPPIVE